MKTLKPYFDNYVDKAFLEGNSLLEAGELEKAIECYNHALTLDEGFTSAMFYKGIALVSLKRYDEAICCCDMVIDTFPDDAEALEYKGVALIEISRYEEALKCYQKVLELDPKNSRALLNIGHIYQMYGNFKEAIVYFDKSLELNPSEKRAWYFKGLSLAEQGFISAIPFKFSEALKCFDKALELAPDDVNLIKDKAKLLLALGNADLAISFYLKAFCLAPNDADVLAALGAAYKNMNKFEAALACYQKLQQVTHDAGLNAEIEYLKSRINNGG